MSILISTVLGLVALYVVYFVVVYAGTHVVIQFHREFISPVKRVDRPRDFFVAFILFITVPQLLVAFCGVDKQDAVMAGMLMWPIAFQGWWISGAVIIGIFLTL